MSEDRDAGWVTLTPMSGHRPPPVQARIFDKGRISKISISIRPGTWAPVDEKHRHFLVARKDQTIRISKVKETPQTFKGTYTVKGSVLRLLLSGFDADLTTADVGAVSCDFGVISDSMIEIELPNKLFERPPAPPKAAPLSPFDQPVRKSTLKG